jgi:inhibitor of KinA sporulation pathway (predicted exonuclease)
MIDIEALAQSTDAVILSVGAVAFDPYASDIEDYLQKKIEKGNFDTFYEKVSVESCLDLNMTIEDSTMTWWAKQSPEAIDAAFSEDNRKSIEQILKELFVFSRHCTHFWAKSPSYDMVILETAAKRLNTGVPWQYHQTRDVRTMEEVTGLSTKGSNTHDALSDAMNQAKIIQKGYQKLGLTRPVWPE